MRHKLVMSAFYGRSIFSVAILVVLNGLLTGCASSASNRSLTLRAVDANTGKPVEGVDVLRDDTKAMPTKFVYLEGDNQGFVVGKTDSNGVFNAETTEGLPSHVFRLRREGYLSASVFTSKTTGDIGVNLPPTDPHQFDRLRRIKATKDIVVKMCPEGTKIAEYKPVWKRTQSVPQHVLAITERSLYEHDSTAPGRADNSLHRFAVVNQYGDYRIIFYWKDLRFNLCWCDAIDFVPPDGTGLFVGSHLPLSSTGGLPDSEKLDKFAADIAQF